MIFRASRVLAGPEHLHDGGGLLVRHGRIHGVLRSAGAVRRARAREAGAFVDLGEGLLVPGLVNAHAHLELTLLAGKCARERAFVAWIRALLRAKRALRTGDLARSVERGAARLLETGTTTVGDIVSTEGGLKGNRLGLRAVLYREVLDAGDASRTEVALRFVRRALRKQPLIREGLAPHAPYSTGRTLLGAAASLARRRKLPVTIHWAESTAEREWLEEGSGDFAGILRASPSDSGLNLIQEAGLLGRGTSLVHGNHPARGEPERIASAGSVIVHCPGTHRFFGRASFPWLRYRRAGIEIGLGTDSLASNEDLDLYREMALFRRSAPAVAPADVWRMATTACARAMGLAGEVGELTRGSRADFALHSSAPPTLAGALEALTSASGRIASTWVAGRQRWPFRNQTGRNQAGKNGTGIPA